MVGMKDRMEVDGFSVITKDFDSRKILIGGTPSSFLHFKDSFHPLESSPSKGVKWYRMIDRVEKKSSPRDAWSHRRNGKER